MHLDKKETRLKIQADTFKSLTNAGFTYTTYKTLHLFTKIDDRGRFLLKTYKGTATKAVDYIAYRTEQERTKAIENKKANIDYWEEYKKKQPKTQAATGAAEVKAQLQKAFPLVKFSVKSENYSGGSSINIHWNFGPSVEAVEAFSSRRQYGKFDGMTDSYNYTGAGVDVDASGNLKECASAKYVFENRTINPFCHDTQSRRRADVEMMHEKIAHFHGYIKANGDWQPATGWEGTHQTASNNFYRMMQKINFRSDDITFLNLDLQEGWVITYRCNRTNKIIIAVVDLNYF